MKNDLDKAIKNLKKEIDDDLDSFFNDLEKEIIKQTPKDTGKAAKGWKRINKPSVDDLKSTEDVFVNEVKYITYLEQGYSDQAPNGILKPALQKVLRKYKR